jgi:putative flippase GtrA
VTCPSLLLRHRPAAAAFLGDVSRARHLRAAVRQGVARLRRDDAVAQFGRFVIVGGAATLVYGLVFLALSGLGYLPAHLAGTVTSTVLANEMHRRLTFRAENRVSWLSAQIEAGGVAAIGLLATTAALGWVHSSTDAVPAGVQIALVTAVTGAIGLVRFVALRWIFRPTGLPAAR